jgi:hypothetical protein
VPAAARDLYRSPLFRKERAYAEQSGVPWFILSAEHGLGAPDEWRTPTQLTRRNGALPTVWLLRMYPFRETRLYGGLEHAARGGGSSSKHRGRMSTWMFA